MPPVITLALSVFYGTILKILSLKSTYDASVLLVILIW